MTKRIVFKSGSDTAEFSLFYFVLRHTRYNVGEEILSIDVNEKTISTSLSPVRYNYMLQMFFTTVQPISLSNTLSIDFTRFTKSGIKLGAGLIRDTL